MKTMREVVDRLHDATNGRAELGFGGAVILNDRAARELLDLVETLPSVRELREHIDYLNRMLDAVEGSRP